MNDSTVLAAGLLVAAAWFYANNQQPPTDGSADTGETDTAPDFTDYASQAADTVSTLFSGEDMSNPNVAAFLGAIRLGEGTSGGDGYRTLCGGGLFDSYSAHPAALGWRGLPLSDSQCAGAGFGTGCVSTAAGAYQINKPTWYRLKDKIGAQDFGPGAQDAAAIQLIREKGALSDVIAGNTAAAVAKVRKVWASLPGAGYGQREVSMSAFNNQFQQLGGVLA